MQRVAAVGPEAPMLRIPVLPHPLLIPAFALLAASACADPPDTAPDATPSVDVRDAAADATGDAPDADASAPACEMNLPRCDFQIGRAHV